MSVRLAPVALLAVGSVLLPGFAVARPIAVPMTPDRWHEAAPAVWADQRPVTLRFDRNEGLPNGVLTVNGGIAVGDGLRFANGSIEFDEEPIGYDDAGIVFRRVGSDAGEFVYLRGNPDCPAAIDCIQYAPVARGRMDWDIYPDHQGPAPIAAAGWNHLRIAVNGETMRVFVNRSAAPTLVVPRLQGLSAVGGLAFKGPARFANLVVDDDPDAATTAAITDGAATGSGAGPDDADADAITAWSAAEPVDHPYGEAVSIASMPAGSAWRPIRTEPNGLVNIGRAFADRFGDRPELAWLRTTVVVATTGRRTLRLGWALQVAVFVDGKRIYAGENPYFPADRRLSPGGRLAPDNATIALDLRAGRHALVLAVGNAWLRGGRMIATPYGWGAEAHLSD